MFASIDPSYSLHLLLADGAGSRRAHFESVARATRNGCSGLIARTGLEAEGRTALVPYMIAALVCVTPERKTEVVAPEPGRLMRLRE